MKKKLYKVRQGKVFAGVCGGLAKYADEHHFFNTRFFVDDGFSGVSFEREGLQAMLHEVEAGNVATVITKDLSRLGRNYLKTGKFPGNGDFHRMIFDFLQAIPPILRRMSTVLPNAE